jgi:hypothetical protein
MRTLVTVQARCGRLTRRDSPVFVFVVVVVFMFVFAFVFVSVPVKAALSKLSSSPLT